MDPITFFVASLPSPYGVIVLAVIGACSIADNFVPQAESKSRWAIPRAMLHYLAMNFDKAARSLGKGRPA